MAKYLFRGDILINTVVKLLILLLTLGFLWGCSSDEIRDPVAVTEPSAAVGDLYTESEVSSSPEDTLTEIPPDETALTPALERFAQITGRPLREWTTKDFSELLSMSNHDLGVDLNQHRGGRNLILGTLISSVHFPNEYVSGYPRGHLAYEVINERDAANDVYLDYNEETYPIVVTLDYLSQGNLLGADFRGSLRDVMKVLGEAAIEYVVHVIDGEEIPVYFMRYKIDGLVFVFESNIGVFTELPLPPPFPTMDEILGSEVFNVHILKEDCLLLDGRTERWILPI